MKFIASLHHSNNPLLHVRGINQLPKKPIDFPPLIKILIHKIVNLKHGSRYA